jgi:hypothetical protein
VVQIDINLVTANAALLGSGNNEITEIDRVPVRPRRSELEASAQFKIRFLVPRWLAECEVHGLAIYVHDQRWVTKSFDRTMVVKGGETLEVEVNLEERYLQAAMGHLVNGLPL